MATKYETIYVDNILSSNNVPYADDLAGTMLVLEDVDINSKVDVTKFLGAPAKRVLISITQASGTPTSQQVEITLNSLTLIRERKVEEADRTIRVWDNPNSVTVVGSSTGTGTWSSYDTLGDISIRSIEITNTALSNATFDIILVP